MLYLAWATQGCCELSKVSFCSGGTPKEAKVETWFNSKIFLKKELCPMSLWPPLSKILVLILSLHIIYSCWIFTEPFILVSSITNLRNMICIEFRKLIPLHLNKGIQKCLYKGKKNSFKEFSDFSSTPSNRHSEHIIKVTTLAVQTCFVLFFVG